MKTVPEIEGVSLPFLPIGGVEELRKPVSHQGIKQTDDRFGRIFDEELRKLKFSAHARSRLISREMDISLEELSRLENAVDRIEEKGGNGALVLLDNRAFIVNVPSRTVITAVDNTQLKENVFTNIDSAVFA